MAKTILVFGATGSQGGSVARALVRDGWNVRALTRNPEGEAARELSRMGVHLVLGDMRDQASLRRAMDGVHGVFSVQTSSADPGSGVSDADEVAFGVAIADEAVAAGVKHFVYSSSAGIRADTGVDHFHTKWQVEQHVRGSGLPFSIVRPAGFMEMLLWPMLGLGQGQLTFVMKPETTIQLVAVEDIGNLTARVFAERERFLGETVELAGDALKGDAIADKISRAIHKLVTYALMPPEMLAMAPMLPKLVNLVNRESTFGRADLGALRALHPGLLDLDAWLAKTGASAIRTSHT